VKTNNQNGKLYTFNLSTVREKKCLTSEIKSF